MPTGALLVVPTGSCEQHGPHLPLDTDTVIASALAAAAGAGRRDLVVAPAVAIGASGEHRGFPGTLSIGTVALHHLAVELARSALPDSTADRSAPHEPVTAPPTAPPTATSPFRGVVFLNAHGGNVEALCEAVALLRAEGRDATVWHARIPGGDPHAGRTETSLMLHLHPELVRMDLAEAGSTARFSEIGEVLRTDGLAAVTPNGVLGDPCGATAREGARLFEALLESLLATLDVSQRSSHGEQFRVD